MALGTPEKMASDFANEYDLKMKVESKGCAHRFVWDSKLAGMDVCFKFGEEV